MRPSRLVSISALPGRLLVLVSARRTHQGGETRWRASRRNREAQPKRSRPAPGVLVLVATRKGAWLYHGDAARRTWRADGPHFLGHIISHLVLDPRDGRTLLAAAKTGHLGPTVFRSTDLGRTWKEAARPPGVREGGGRRAGPRGRSHVLADARPRERAGRLVRRHLAAGAVPLGGRRRDAGSRSPASTTTRSTAKWMGTEQDGTPDGPKLHSIIVDPRDPAHLYFAMSGGGVHESRRPRPDLDAARRRARGGRRLRPGRPHVPRSALRAALSEQPGPAVPAEPLRHLPDRPAVERVGARSARPCRSGSATSAFRWWCTRATRTPPGCSRWTATTVWPRTSPEGMPGGLRHAQRRQDLAAARRRPAGAPGVVDGEAPGDDRGRARPGRPLLRHDQRRAVDEPRRRPPLVVHRAAPAGDLRGGGRGTGAG